MPDELSIAVIGLGGIGSTLAFYLSQHHKVTAVARSGSTRLAQLERDQAIITVKDEKSPLEAVRSDLNSAASQSFDLVIVTLLSHQITSILPALQKSSAKRILFMCNMFDPQSLQDSLGGDKDVAFGMPFIQARVVGSGQLDSTATMPSLFDRQELVTLFKAAGVPATLEQNMKLWLKCHTPFCIGFEAIAYAGVQRNGGAAWFEAMTLARGMQEIFKLIHLSGATLYPSYKAGLMYTLPPHALASVLWSMSRITSFRTLLATGVQEAVNLVHFVVEAAKISKLDINIAQIQAMKPVIST